MKLRALLLLLLIAICATALAVPPAAIVLSDPSLPGSDPALVRAVSGAVQSAGYLPTPVTVDGLLARGALTPNSCRMLVLPQCRALPALLAPVVENYLKAGGNLIALGAPAWDDPLIKGDDGRWISIADYSEKLALAPPGRIVYPFDGPLTGWTRSSDHPNADALYETAAVSSHGRSDRAMHAIVSNLQGWDTLDAPPSSSLFKPGETVTVFSARGGPRTRALAVEWEERDGARWIATVPLSERWQRYSLTPSAFKSWSNSPEREAHGFQPQNAGRIKIGLAYTHTGQMSGRHEYWISSVGLSAESAAGPDLSAEANRVHPIDTLCPRYKFFPIHGPVQISLAYAGQPAAIGVPAGLTPLGSSPRPGGSGYNKGRTRRWMPMLLAVSSPGSAPAERRGFTAALTVHGPGDPYAGGAWLVLNGFDGGSGSAFYRDPNVLQAITNQAQRIRQGLFLLEAGTDGFCYEPMQAVTFGAKLLNIGISADTAMVQIKVTDHAGHEVMNMGGEVPAEAGGTGIHQATWQSPANWPAGGYHVKVVLMKDEVEFDRLEHDITCYTPPDQPDYVQKGADGHFYSQGKLWRINGVNYMPSSGIAQEDGRLFEHWMSREAYDPEVVERDLTRIEQIGLNAVSIFVYRDCLDSQNLLDVLTRCRAHHLKVNLSLRPGVLDALRAMPARSYNDAMAAAIENFTFIIHRYGLNRDDGIFAFETAWEPNFGSQQSRTQMDAQWLEWITAHYGGSLKLAEGAWNHATPRDAAGKITNPTAAQLAGDEPKARRMVADYRHFLDAWLDSTYGAATRAIKALAPHQMVSFRMASAGFPGDDQRGDLPYQFEGLTRAVDFLSPECYGRVGGEEGEEGILFEAAYARAVAAPNRMPVIWAETGFTAWDPATQRDDPGALDFQGHYLDTFYRLAIQSGVDGIFFWWYPGGFRTGENSDFGIFNPDGTDRPATAAIRKWGKVLLSAPAPAPPDLLLEFNRDQNADGIHGVFRALKEPFAAALKAGKRPGLKVGKLR